VTSPHCIAVDWGTSSLRASLLGKGADVLDRISRPKGILAVPTGGFAAELDAACGQWRAAHPYIPVLMSGMIGSQQGWVDAPYLDAPCGPDELVSRMVTVPGSDGVIRIMPGIRCTRAEGVPEIMRGEETQIGGIVTAHGITDGLFCVPGTHSKWVRVAAGRIESFATFMTGECFALLRTHSILGRLMDGDAGDSDTFGLGLKRAAEPGGLLHHLFAVRSMGIMDALPKPNLASYLSGQLIGAEIKGALDLFGEIPQVHLIACGAVGSRYAEAFAFNDLSTTRWDAEQAANAGLRFAAESMTQ